MALNVWPVKAVERRAIRKANYLANKDLFAVEQHCSLYLCLFQLIGPISGVFHLQFLNHILLQHTRGLFVRCPEIPQSFEFKLHGSLIASHIQLIEYTSIWCEPVKDVEPVLLLVQGTLFQPEKLHCSQGLGIIAVLGVNVVICYLF